MALFGKKNGEAKKLAEQQAKLAKEQKQKLLSPFEIHVMPQKFVGAEVRSVKAGGGKGGKVILIVVFVIVIVGLLAFGAYQMYKSLNRPISPAANTNLPIVNVNTNTEPVVNTNPPVNTNVAVNTNTEVNVNVPVETNTNVNTNLNENVNVAPPIESTTQFLPALDIDQDKLTDVEEELYGTELRKPDTDGDGFLDGDEVMNLYSPLLAGNNFLKDSPAVNAYTNEEFAFDLLYPSSWLAKATDASKREIMFTSATGEYFTLNIFDDADNASLSQWVLDNQPGINANELISGKTRSGLQMLTSPDGMLAFIYAPTQSRIYQLKYIPGTVQRLNFLTTFVMMSKSLSVK